MNGVAKRLRHRSTKDTAAASVRGVSSHSDAALRISRDAMSTAASP
ncbi:hypothetical protein [Catenuloplanes nepalensis]|nr:hypothetical protein [Catenuloplanes nepalensis]